VGLAIVNGQSVTVFRDIVAGWWTGFYGAAVLHVASRIFTHRHRCRAGRVLADHATAVVHRERTTCQLVDSARALQVGAALGRVQRVATAAGILVLMALHHLTATQARQLLARASDRNASVDVGVCGQGSHHRGAARKPLHPHSRLRRQPASSTAERCGPISEQGTGGRPPDQPVTARAQFFRCIASRCRKGASRDAVR